MFLFEENQGKDSQMQKGSSIKENIHKHGKVLRLRKQFTNMKRFLDHGKDSQTWKSYLILKKIYNSEDVPSLRKRFKNVESFLDQEKNSQKWNISILIEPFCVKVILPSYVHFAKARNTTN